MKILQYYDDGRTRLGLVEGDNVFPVDFSGDMVDFISEAPEIVRKDAPVSLDKIDFAPALTTPSKIICVGLNYLAHIRESPGEVPENPLNPDSALKTVCETYTEATDDLMLDYSDGMLLRSWAVLSGMSLLFLLVTGILLARTKAY